MIVVAKQDQTDRRSAYPDMTNSGLASLAAFERSSASIGKDSPEIYALVRGLQRQLNLQRTKLDIARSRIGEMEMKLRQVSADLMTAQELERRRIALDMHDSIGQSLNAIGFGVGSALETCRLGHRDATAESLTALDRQVKATVEEVRRIARNLRPAMLDDLGIVGTLSWFLRDFGKIHRTLNLQVEISAPEEEVPITLRTPIFRIVQEGLSNVVKHSDATEVFVSLSSNEKGIFLEIADNGSGFRYDADGLEFDPCSAGLGLKGMRERVEFTGGDFDIQSAPNQGTWVRCNWGTMSYTEGKEYYAAPK